MSRSIVAVAVLLLLVSAAAVGLLVASDDGTVTEPKAQTPATGTIAPAAGKTPADEDPAQRTKPAARPGPEADATSVAGKVCSEGGEPIEGARVECYRVGADEPDDRVRVAKSLLGDLVSADDMDLLMQQSAQPRRARMTMRMGGSGRRAAVSVGTDDGASGTSGKSDPPPDPARAMRIGMDIGGKLMSDPSALPKLQQVMRMAMTGIEDDAKLPLAARTTTDAAGAFRFDGLEPGRVELRVTAARFQRTKDRAKVGDVSLEVLLEPAGMVIGEVRSGGRPLAGATARVRTRTFVTGADGRFVHDGAQPPKEPVIVSAPGHVGGGVWAEVSTDPKAEPKVAVIELEPAATIRGRVSDRAGAPVPGASVSVLADVGGLMTMFLPQAGGAATLPAALPVTTSGPDGVFVLEGVRPGSVELRCEKTGFLAAKSARVRTVAKETVEGVDFVLVRESAVEGRVTDASGAPVAGATVKFAVPAEGLMKQAAVFFGGVYGSGRSGEDGTYRVAGLTDGLRSFVVEAEGYLTQRGEDTLPAEGSLHRDFTLQPGVEVSGVVLLPSGAPAPGATVWVQSATEAPTNPMIAMVGAANRKTAVTDIEGKWRARGLQQGPHQLTAAAPGYLEASLRDVADGATDLTLTLGAAVTLRGRVVAAETGTPVGGAAVIRKGKTTRAGGNPFLDAMASDPSTTTAPDGTFEISGLAPGPWELYARAKGYADSPRLKLSGAAGETLSDLSLALPPGSSLSGRVVRKADGSAIEGALVYVPLGRGPMAGMNITDITQGEPSAPPDSESTKTAADGTFTISGLTPGKVTLEVRATGLAPATVAGTEVPGSATVVQMSEGGALEGVVWTEDGRVHENVTVAVQRGMMGQGGKIGTTDREGHYRIDRLPPGSYQVMIFDPESPMGVSGIASASVRDGETTQHDFGKPGAGRVVTGEVLRDGKPFPKATLVLFGGTVGIRMSESDDAGAFRFANVPPGDYSVSVQSEAFGGGSNSVRVNVGPDADPPALRVEVSSLVVEGSVVEAESGKPVQMAQVLLLAPSSGRGGSLQDLVARQKGQTFTGADGKFRIADVPAGSFSLRVSASGFSEARLEGVAAGGQPVAVSLARGLELAVTVVGPDDMPVANASVVPDDGSGDEGNPFDMSMSKITGADGIARLRLAPGRYTLRIRAASFPEAEAVADSAQGALTVRLDAGGVLDVTVRGAGGVPVSGATVRLLDASGAEVRSGLHLGNLFGGGVTDASGRLTRDGLRTGKLTVVAKTPAGREARAEASVAAGAVTKVEVAVE